MFASRTDWPLVPNRLSKQLEERRRRGLPVLDLTESNPTRCGFNYDVQEVLGALTDARSLTYDPDPRGPLASRLAVVDYYAERGIELTPEQLFLTTSTSEAYSFVFRLLADPGDNVLVPRPSYPLLDFLARLDSVELNSYSLVYDQGWQIDLGSVERAMTPRTRAIVVIHPNNPTGSYVRPEERQALLECCSKRQLALVADEVFFDYALGPEAAEGNRRAASHAEACDALTFTLSGLSKISALPQMKLAWVVVSGPGEILRDVVTRLELIADTYLSLSLPLAHALPRLLELRRSMQPQILKRVRSNLCRLDEQISPASPVTRLKAEGGWNAILRLPSTQSDEDWAIELLREDGVLLHPGHFYDFAAEGYLVVSLLTKPATFEEGTAKVLARVSRSV